MRNILTTLQLLAYHVALVARGSGAYSYTWAGPRDLPRGSLCAVSFRHGMELGVILGEDQSPPQRLLPLWPLPADCRPFGALLLDLAELALAGADEVAGHMLFTSAGSSLRLSFGINDPDLLEGAELTQLALFSGRLSPAKSRKLLRACSWERLCELGWQDALRLELGIAGLPGESRSSPRWRRWFKVDPASASLLGLDVDPDLPLPGSYLAGFHPEVDYASWPSAKAPQQAADPLTPPKSELKFEPCGIPAGWEIMRTLPLLRDVPIRRCFASWARLRRESGLFAELASAVFAGQNLLLICPQVWMLDRLWPQLAALAGQSHRFHSEAGTGASAHILGALEKGGQVVCGTEAAWKLAAHGYFDRVLLVDPAHPQYEPESDPAVDPRSALLASLARRGGSLDIIEMGLSIFDGRAAFPMLHFHAPRREEAAEPQPGQPADSDPLPLELRRPDRRRLVYFNRLGGSRRLLCMECSTALRCPQCNSNRINYSFALRRYSCPDCDFSIEDLRCQSCGLATISAQSPGLEAMQRRPGDLLVSAGPLKHKPPPEASAVIGTAQLLEAQSEFWPQDIIYIHAEEKLGILDYWPAAVDMAQRLAALYANPELERVHIVSERLLDQLGTELDAALQSRLFMQELKLRALTELPPPGRLVRLRLRGSDRETVLAARQALGDELRQHSATKLLRMGGAWLQRAVWHATAFAVNPELDAAKLQQLRWRLNKGGVGLTLRALRGPWL